MKRQANYELEIETSSRDVRVLLLHEFRLSHKATKAANNICSTMGKEVMSIRTVQYWFNRFKNRNLELDDLPRSGRPREINTEVLDQLIEEEPRLTTRCLAEHLECFHTIIERYLGELGKTWKYGIWIPHELSLFQLRCRVDSCMELLTSHRNNEWLCNLITGDEK